MVSYFNTDAPIKGKPIHSTEYNGITYRFDSAQNKTVFLASPEKYLPQYGGWCAFAMAKGDYVEINPMAYLIQEEKLYLFYKTRWINTRTKWLKEPKALEVKANIHWHQ